MSLSVGPTEWKISPTGSLSLGAEKNVGGLDFTLGGRQRTCVGCGAAGSRVCRLVSGGADLMFTRLAKRG